jgi:tRNA pseudouridine55 synthase
MKGGMYMDGVLLLDKPRGMTSHDVVNLVRQVYQTKKVGHAGTLDPDATGLLVIGINQGTRILEYLTAADKIYEATICFGIATDTLDAEGEVVYEKEVKDLPNLEQVITSFKGEYEQIPPMYSAIKIKGKKLYEYARKGIEVPRPSRTINIYDIQMISKVRFEEKKAYVTYRVKGSKGLYVRTLSHDIGAKLEVPAHNHSLRRVASGRFLIEEAYSIDELKRGEAKLMSLTSALCHLPKVTIKPSRENIVKNGGHLPLSMFVTTKLTRVVNQNDQLLALYEKHPNKQVMKAVKVFHKE